MRFLSIFSGIEAASVAWKPLGWQCVGIAEVDPFPCAVLAHHYPDVPNLGDVTAITDEQIAALGPIDVVVGGSPCFTAGHLVLCKRGLIPIEDVAVGDEVWTHAHRWRAVTATMTRRAPTVRMRGQGHAAMRSTPDHKFYAARTQRTWNGHGYTRSVVEPEWVAASDMAGKRWATPIEITGLAAPQDLESLDAAYLAGLYLGDGHIGKHAEKVKKAVILSVGNHKRDRLAERLRAAWGVITVTPHGESVTRLQLSRTRVACALLREFGEYCHRKTIPPWALCAPREWREALLAGVLDTDGSPIANGYRITTVSRALAVGLRLLAASLGYATTLDFTERPPQTVIDGRTVNQRDTWTVYMRKAARASELRAAGHAWGLVRSVSDAGVDTVYDITVDEDHSFVCDGLVVHNCQDLSIAGKRAGLAGERSGLFHEQLRIFHAARHLCGARFLVWENVPGAFSTHGGRDFAVVVGAMAGCSVPVPADGWGPEGVVLGEHGLVEWAVLDAQWFGVAQRRRRVFAVLDVGDWAGRPPILLEPESMRGDFAPSREARKDTSGSTGDGVARCLTTGEAKRQDWETCNFVAGVAPTLQAGGNSTGGDRPPGTTVDTCDSLVVTHSGRGTPIVPVQPYTLAIRGRGDSHDLEYRQDGTANALLTPNGGRGGIGVGAIAFDTTQITSAGNYSNPKHGDPCHPLAAGAHAPAIAFAHQAGGKQTTCGYDAEVGTAPTLAKCQTPAVHHGMAVRRLTPEECESLQGFPRGYTLIPVRGKPAADGNRYRALGNSFAVPVVRWIGEQIQLAAA